jgi:LysR family transcriptional regulator, carnitine catabolism transcriptional activator
MNFTSRQLHAFLLVARYRSFTRAAHALFITPSGLSVLIKELETQLGFRLFDRTTRQVVPTSYGNEMLPFVQKTLSEFEAATTRIGRSATQASRSLSLGAAPLISANVLPQAIKEFRGHYPALRIQLFDGTQSEILRMIESGKLDMGLGVYGPTPGIRRTPFFRFSLMVIRADNDAAAHRASTTWSSLQGETMISLPPGSPIQKMVDKHLTKAGVVCRNGAVVNLLDTQIAMVEAGEGIAVIPAFGLAAVRNRHVAMSRLVSPVVNLDFFQISDRGKTLPPGADEFTAFLKSYISRWAGRSGAS